MKCDKLQVRTIYVDWKGGEICYYNPYEVNEAVAELKETHKKEVAQLLMKISSLEKLVETADKLLKQTGGFTIKDIKFGGVSVGSNLGTSSKEAE